MHQPPRAPRRHAQFTVALGLLPGLLPLALADVAPAAAQVPGAALAQEPARLLVLGSYHFANPGLDVVQTEVADVLSPAKQAEVAAIVDALARFRPTRVAVEAPLSSAPALDSLYVAWRAGRHALTRNETQQLGFRLAERFDHARVYPIDHPGDFPFGPLMEYAAAHDPDAAAAIQRFLADVTELMNRQQRELGIADILRWHNDPETIRGGHGMYVRMNAIGAGDGYVGADLVSAWYERNLRIFANIQALARPGERVLVIIGSGHVPILRELASYAPGIELVDALAYLP